MLGGDRIIAVGLAAALWAAPAWADFTVGTGAQVDFGDATVDFACGRVDVAGQATGTAARLISISDFSLAAGGSFAPGASQLALGGGFANAGNFVAGSSRVEIVDACGSGTSLVAGSSDFYDLSVASTAAKRLVLPVGLAQGVAHALTLQGVAGNLLRVESAAAGQRAVFAVAGGASQSVDYVQARDNQASLAAIAPGAAAAYHSIDGGNLVNWFENGGGGPTPGNAVPTPTLNGPARTLLIVLLLAVAAAVLRPRLHRRRSGT
jgi:hypothetical protein